jgi:glutathione S-transferase
MMPDLRLWYSPGACSLATHIILQETTLPFTPLQANIPDPKDPAKLPEDFRKINPKKRVPVLAIDDEIITEAPAILLAISELKPELALYGRTGIERVRVAEWLNYISGTLHTQGFGALIRPERFSADPAQYASLRQQAKITITQCFADIEKALQGREFAVGGGYTVVDAYLVPFWRWGKKFGWRMEEEYPAYSRLVGRTMVREAARRALETERLGVEEFGVVEGKL